MPRMRVVTLPLLVIAVTLPGCGADTSATTAEPPTTTTSTAPTTTTATTAATSTTLAPAEVGRYLVTVSEAGPYLTHPRFPDPLVDVYQPEADGPFPTVVWLHGGGQKRQGLDMPPAIASLGAVVVVPTWTSDTTDELGVYDWEAPGAACAVRYARSIAADHGGDPDALILAGHSAGAILALTIGLVGDRLDTSACTAPEEHTRARFVVPDDAPNASEYTKWGVEGEFLDLLDPALHVADNPDLEGVYFVHSSDGFFPTVAAFYAGTFAENGVSSAAFGDATTNHTMMRDPESPGGQLYLAVMQWVLGLAG